MPGEVIAVVALAIHLDQHFPRRVDGGERNARWRQRDAKAEGEKFRRAHLRLGPKGHDRRSDTGSNVPKVSDIGQLDAHGIRAGRGVCCQPLANLVEGFLGT